MEFDNREEISERNIFLEEYINSNQITVETATEVIRYIPLIDNTFKQKITLTVDNTQSEEKGTKDHKIEKDS